MRKLKKDCLQQYSVCEVEDNTSSESRLRNSLLAFIMEDGYR